MAEGLSKVLILGHSFVKRLSRDIQLGSDSRIDASFGLQGSAAVKLYGVGGRTVQKLRAYDLDILRNWSPDVVILEVGTNDMSELAPEVVGSAVVDLVELILESFSVRAVCWCCVIPRGIAHSFAQDFFQRTLVLNNYVSVVFDSVPGAFCWQHRIFNHPSKDFYLSDGVHLNPSGQYQLFRSYRGAILKALRLI